MKRIGYSVVSFWLQIFMAGLLGVLVIVSLYAK